MKTYYPFLAYLNDFPLDGYFPHIIEMIVSIFFEYEMDILFNKYSFRIKKYGRLYLPYPVREKVGVGT